MGFLGDIGKFLFGEDEEIKTKEIPRWTPEQQALFRGLYGTIQPRLGQPWRLEPTGEETRYLKFLRGYEPWYRGLVSELYSPEATREFYRKYLYPEWQSEVLPRIRASYAGPGFWGSARAEAETESLKDLALKEAEDIYNLEQARRLALMQLAEGVPTAMGTAAELSRRFAPVEPVMSPYYQAAYQLLGLDPYYVVGGMTQPKPGFLASLAPAFGKQLGSKAAEGGIGGIFKTIASALPFI